MATLVLGVVVGMGIAGVIMVPRIGGVDGDQRQVAQVFATLEALWFGRIGLCDHIVGEFVRNAMLVDRDERDRARLGRVAQPLDDACAGRSHTCLRSGLLGLDQFTVFRAMCMVGTDAPFAIRALVDRDDPPTFGRFAEDAQHLARVGADAANEPGLIVVIFTFHQRQPGQNAVTFAKRRVTLARDQQNDGFFPLAMPLHRLGKKIAIAVRPRDQQDRDRRQAVRVLIAALALFQMALGLQLFQHALQVDPGRALDAKGFGDVALGGQRWVLFDPVEDLGFAGYLAHTSAGSTQPPCRHGKS